MSSSAAKTVCLDESESLAFAEGRSHAMRRYQDMASHVSTCPDCRSLVSALVQSASIVQAKSEIPFADTALSDSERGAREHAGERNSSKHADQRESLYRTTERPASLIGMVVAGRYRIDRVLGVGGMGVVVAAEHIELGSTFAIKFLRDGGNPSSEGRARFLREARACAKLRGEHVVRVTDTGMQGLGHEADEQTPFMVMELLEGESLGTLLRTKTKLSSEECALYTLQACEALAEAHAVGIIHRDLKPDNLFLAKRLDGTPVVKVVDFGISRIEGDALLSATSQSMLMGTPRYMAPEQMRNAHDVDARADIWSLGIILYELLTGKPAFDAPSIAQLLTRVQLEPHPPLASLLPSLPKALIKAVEDCLAKDPALRTPSVQAFARALAPFAGLVGKIHLERIEKLSTTENGKAVSLKARTPPAPKRPFILVSVAVVLVVATATTIAVRKQTNTTAPSIRLADDRTGSVETSHSAEVPPRETATNATSATTNTPLVNRVLPVPIAKPRPTQLPSATATTIPTGTASVNTDPNGLRTRN
jgi:eukaryotic-like serine/threonine-protein kinase